MRCIRMAVELAASAGHSLQDAYLAVIEADDKLVACPKHAVTQHWPTEIQVYERLAPSGNVDGHAHLLQHMIGQ